MIYRSGPGLVNPPTAFKIEKPDVHAKSSRQKKERRDPPPRHANTSRDFNFKEKVYFVFCSGAGLKTTNTTQQRSEAAAGRPGGDEQHHVTTEHTSAVSAVVPLRNLKSANIYFLNLILYRSIKT